MQPTVTQDGGAPIARTMLRQNLHLLDVVTSGEGFTDLTAKINDTICASGLDLGVVSLACLHTSCSITVNENADPRVLHDLAAYLQALVPETGFRSLSGDGGRCRYAHNDEGPDDMPAHIRTALTCTALQLSFQRGRLVLGSWQAIYLWEHRRAPQHRRISVHLIGE